jgi:hypothetical protein
MEGKYVIIDLRTMDFMKDENGIIKYYDTEEEAGIVCGVYEHENAWILKLIYNHIEEKVTYHEDDNGYWFKTTYDKDGKRIYMENQDGVVFDNKNN